VKVNTDAVFDADSCKGSIGVVVQDHNSLVLAAAARWFDSVLDALTAEAIAAKEGMELAVECGFRENCS
jgi:tRNA(Phe) wybutosine-synthesizing methylase Tyw3